MFDVFGWLRRKAKDAVLGGVADAVEQVAAGDGPPDLEKLRAILATAEVKALPPAEEESGGKRRGK